MKKLIIGCGLVAAASLAFGQGTVQFSNGGLNAVSSGIFILPSSWWVVVPTSPAGLINYGLFYGIGESTSLTFLSSTMGVNSTSVAGVIASATDSKSAITTLPIPGTTPGESDVWVQVRGWTGSYGTDWQAARQASLDGTGFYYFGETGIINVLQLGPPTGPGAILWQSATQTDPHKFAGGFALLDIGLSPEPGTFALAGLGAGMLMLFHRRR